ncbi:MAG TPA: response regulator [Vicinamibacterales bacterium]|nr:response regulator [Vicinamibacterales bacterium]
MGSRILLIEDYPAMRELMSYLLNSSGHSTIVASNGADGVAEAVRSRPDLVLCDLALPILDGFGVARRLKADPSLAGIPLIAVTGSEMPAEPDTLRSSGFDGYITKPITPETFVAEVEAFMLRQEPGADHSRR